MKIVLALALAAGLLAALGGCSLFNPADTKAPGDVVSLSASERDGSVKLAWTDPVDTDLHHLELTWTPGGTSPVRIASGVFAAEIFKLSNGTSYTFTMKSVDAAGNHSPGVTANAIPDAGTAGAGNINPPAVPSSPEAVAGDSVVTLNWEDPPNTDLSRIEVSWTGGSSGALIVPCGVGTVQVPGLVNGSAYSFTIRAVNHSGLHAEVTVGATPQAGLDSTPPEIAELRHSPDPAYAGQTVTLIPVVTDLESAFTLTYDTDDDLVFDDGKTVFFAAGGSYTVRVKATSGGGSSQAQATIIVQSAAVPAVKVLSGGLGAGSDADLAAFEAGGYTIISGDLDIHSLTGTSLAGLEALTQVTGNVRIHGNAALNDLAALSNLVEIGGSLTFDASGYGFNTALASLAGLAVNRIGGDLAFAYMPALSDISALSSLESVHSISIYRADILVSLAGLENVTALPGSLSIAGNAALSDATGLANLESVSGSITFDDNASLADLSSLVLTSFVGSLTLSNCPNLTAAPGLTSATNIGGVTIANTGFTDLAFLSGKTTYNGPVAISGNNSLTSLSGFRPDLVDGYLDIRDNDALSGVSSLAGAQIVGTLSFQGNAALTALSGLSGIRIVNGNLQIGGPNSASAVGTSLADLSGIDGVRITNGSLVIGNTPVHEAISEDKLFSLDAASDLIDFVFFGNNQLTSLANLGNLKPKASVVISSNSTLADLSALAGVSSLSGALVITDNVSLLDSSGLASLASVAGGVEIYKTGLVDLSGLHGLVTVGGPLYVHQNASLAKLDLVALESVNQTNATYVTVIERGSTFWYSIVLCNNPLLANLADSPNAGNGLDALVNALVAGKAIGYVACPNIPAGDLDLLIGRSIPIEAF